MPIETLDDILEDLADKFGINGAEERNHWIITMRSRIAQALLIELLREAVRQ